MSSCGKRPLPLYVLKSPGEQFRSPVHSLSFYTAEELLVGTEDGSIVSWNMNTLRMNDDLSIIPSLQSPCLQILNIDGGFITQSKNGNIVWWLRSEGKCVENIQFQSEHMGFCRAQTLKVYDYKYALVYANQRTSLVLNALNEGNRTNICTFDLADSSMLGTVTSCRPVGNGQILGLYESGDMLLWDVRHSLGPVSGIKVHNDPMTADYDVETSQGICGGPTDDLDIFTIEGKMIVKNTKKIEINKPGIACIKIQPAVEKSRIFVAGCWDGRIRIFSLKSKKEIAILFGIHEGSIHDIQFSPGVIVSLQANRPVIAAGAKDGTISLWDTDMFHKNIIKN